MGRFSLRYATVCGGLSVLLLSLLLVASAVALVAFASVRAVACRSV